MTGPSLAGLWGRKAGSLESFERYSPALKDSNVVWDEKSLDEWLKSPSDFIPQSRMTFAGISDAHQRADLVAFLKTADSAQASEPILKVVESEESVGLTASPRDGGASRGGTAEGISSSGSGCPA